ncbi:uncharacterized protein EDB91DRAFT_1259934 [Suillus paluster]|uniref:uncharacterized protein n=1 Tax=Suillus paluster TaxID=48578 RepID=UPI001B85BB0F|nr:uncharacterized protein EDB91DRAFT_1259934 [Suillus paluster]KAG1717282.1 hypothetical protein EDB91DRAFT_1259934 [Suillus paluster]
MSKWPATSEIAPKASFKRVKQTDVILKMVKMFVSTEAEVDKWSGEEIDYSEEDDEAFVVPDEACDKACDNDRASGNHRASVSDPLKDVTAWRILKEFLDTDMGFGQMQARLLAHLGSQYREEDWAEAKSLLFSVGSFHAYDLLEVEFSDDPMSSAHWESVLDAIREANTPEDKLQVFTRLTSTPSAASNKPPRKVGVIEEPTSITQDVETMPAPDLPMWLVTVPLSKASFLATQLKNKGFEVYTHSTLPGRLCVKAEDTYVIREAWPSSHVNCFFDVIFLPPEDQSSVEHRMTIPGWYRPIRGPYRFDVGLAHSYNRQADTLRVLFPSRAHPEWGIWKDLHVPRLHNPPDGVSTSGGRGETYIHGLLVLDLRRTAVVEVPIPVPESIRLHKESTYCSNISPYYTSERTCIISRMIWASGPWAKGRYILDYDGCAGSVIIPDGDGWAHVGNM